MLVYTKHIYGTIESFYLCTHIPIKAFSYEGDLIHSTGYDKYFEELFNKNMILEKCKKSVLRDNLSLPIVETLCINGIKFTIFSICPKNINKGYYVLGPYVTSMDKHHEVVYKPGFCISHMLTLLHRIAGDMIPSNLKKVLFEPSYNLHVRKAIDYINSNYKRNITLDDISSYLNINKYYFCNIFKKQTGKTYSQFLNYVRINKSKNLLSQDDLSILDIALSVGFNNQNYYSMVFKKHTNKTPLEFRSELINK